MATIMLITHQAINLSIEIENELTRVLFLVGNRLAAIMAMEMSPNFSAVLASDLVDLVGPDSQ